MLPFDSLYYGSTFYVVPSSWWQLLVSRVGQTMVYRQFCIHSSRSAFVFSFSLGAKRSFVACRTQVQYSTMDWRVGTLFEIFNPEKVKKFVNPLFCLYIGYFSLASVGVRSAATHLQPNLYHCLEWKNQQIKTKNMTWRGVCDAWYNVNKYVNLILTLTIITLAQQ